MIDQGDLLEPSYSPRRIRFLLRHWPALEALAESPSTSDGEAERLRREWELLQDRRGIDCICGEVRDWPEVPASPGGGRHMESADHPWSDLIVDLERGVEDGLLLYQPVSWRVTQRICVEMGVTMLGRWEFREAVWHHHAGEACRRPMLDARATFHEAATLIAAELGWEAAYC